MVEGGAVIAPGDLSGPTAALLAGVVTSLHCVGMCGPLACAACTSSCGRGDNVSAALYHATRLASYGLVGFVAGLLGERISQALLGGATRGMTWVFVLFFLAVVAGLDKRLQVPSLGRYFQKIFSRTGGAGPLGKAALLGTLTPLLPCAPLYLVVAAAALSGSPLSGSVLMVAFGIGTVPLLFGVQNRLAALERRWSPRAMDLTRRGLALASIILLLMRGTYTAATGCPMCH
jgi:uncharacterized protein